VTAPAGGGSPPSVVATSLACFDLDGCLVDSTPAITASIRAAGSALSVAIDPDDDLVWCVGPPLARSMELLLDRAGADPSLRGAMIDAYREDYRATWLERTTVIEGIADVLAACRRAGIRLAVVTSKPAPIARPILDGLGLGDAFEALHAPEEDHRAEPKRTTLDRALTSLRPAGGPDATTMIGDRSHDVTAGLACGTRAIGVTWGAGDRTELETAGAHHVVDRPPQLRALLVPEGD
jgi:phosphoglycolate phosphatase